MFADQNIYIPCGELVHVHKTSQFLFSFPLLIPFASIQLLWKPFSLMLSGSSLWGLDGVQCQNAALIGNPVGSSVRVKLRSDWSRTGLLLIGLVTGKRQRNGRVPGGKQRDTQDGRQSLEGGEERGTEVPPRRPQEEPARVTPGLGILTSRALQEYISTNTSKAGFPVAYDFNPRRLILWQIKLLSNMREKSFSKLEIGFKMFCCEKILTLFGY